MTQPFPSVLPSGVQLLRTVLIRMAYCYPEKFVEIDGVKHRAPGSPTRAARETDVNTWYEEVPIYG